MLSLLAFAALLLPELALAQTHPSSGGPTKQSLTELIGRDTGTSDLTPETTTRVRNFLEDRSQPVRERLEVKITFEQARLKRRQFASRDQRLQAHAEHAAELIRDYPDQPEGYGYLLSLAKAENPANARRLAGSLLSSPAPEPFQRGAQRVLARLNLEGTPLRLAGADAAVAAARGQPLAIYCWTEPDDGIREAVARLAATRRDFAFIGINLDTDVTTAQAAAPGLPGTQFYDAAGLDGPLARQLHFTMKAGLYLVDAHGIIRDVDAHRDPFAAAERLAPGGRP